MVSKTTKAIFFEYEINLYFVILSTDSSFNFLDFLPGFYYTNTQKNLEKILDLRRKQYLSTSYGAEKSEVRKKVQFDANGCNYGNLNNSRIRKKWLCT